MKTRILIAGAFVGMMLSQQVVIAAPPPDAAKSNQGTGIIVQDEVKLEKGLYTEILRDARRLIEEARANPTPPLTKEVLEKSKCVAVFPSIKKGAAVVGLSGGTGVASCRNASGAWSELAFLELGGLSVGLQLGAKSSSAIVAFLSDKAAAQLQQGTFSFGADWSVAGGTASSGSRAESADVVMSSDTQGLFAGAALSSSGIKEDAMMMQDFYKEPKTITRTLTTFTWDKSKVPSEANEFIMVLPPKVVL